MKERRFSYQTFSPSSRVTLLSIDIASWPPPSSVFNIREIHTTNPSVIHLSFPYHRTTLSHPHKSPTKMPIIRPSPSLIRTTFSAVRTPLFARNSLAGVARFQGTVAKQQVRNNYVQSQAQWVINYIRRSLASLEHGTNFHRPVTQKSQPGNYKALVVRAFKTLPFYFCMANVLCGWVYLEIFLNGSYLGDYLWWLMLGRSGERRVVGGALEWMWTSCGIEYLEYWVMGVVDFDLDLVGEYGWVYWIVEKMSFAF